MSKKTDGNKGFANSKKKKAEQKEKDDKLLDQMLGEKGTPERDEADEHIASAKMSTISIAEAFNLQEEKKYANLDVRIFLDTERGDGKYSANFIGSPAEFARALFALATADPMYDAIITGVYEQLAAKKNYDKLNPNTIENDTEKN